MKEQNNDISITLINQFELVRENGLAEKDKFTGYLFILYLSLHM